MQGNPKTGVYRVHTPLVAQRQTDGRAEYMAIPRGSMMLVPDEEGDFDLVDVEYEGKTLAVYRRDIDERAQRMPDR
jgi:hypothetical protein